MEQHHYPVDTIIKSFQKNRGTTLCESEVYLLAL